MHAEALGDINRPSTTMHYAQGVQFSALAGLQQQLCATVAAGHAMHLSCMVA